MSDMFRNKGYYWVKMFGKWQIAGWNGKDWYFTGTEESANDSEIEKIGDRVVRPDAETATLDIPLVVFSESEVCRLKQAEYNRGVEDGKTIAEHGTVNWQT